MCCRTVIKLNLIFTVSQILDMMDWNYLLNNMDNFNKKEYMNNYVKVFELVSSQKFNIHDRVNFYQAMVLNVKPRVELPRTINLHDHWKWVGEQLNIKSLVALKMSCKQFNQNISIGENTFKISIISNMMAYLQRTTRGTNCEIVLRELGISSDYLKENFSIKNLIRHLQIHC